MPATDDREDSAVVAEHAERGGVALGQGRRGGGGQEAVRQQGGEGEQRRAAELRRERLVKGV